MKLTAKANYRSRLATFQAGQTREIDDVVAEALLADAPELFEKAVDKPPMDKAVKSPRVSK